MNLLEELDGSGWSIQQALLTTFSFNPRFFSQYVRPRLNSRNCDLPVVFVDDRRYGQNIDTNEWLEAPIGSDYLLEPVQTGGVFHPKVNLFASERSVYATITSANLTIEEYAKAAQVGETVGFQRSWLDDDEREVGQQFHIVREIREFFDSLVSDGRFVSGRDASEYVAEMLATTEWLDDFENTVPDREEHAQSTRFLYNLDGPILEQALDAFGEVESVQLYAPFYGSPGVVNDIVSATGADRAEIIVESESTALDLKGLADALVTPFDVREMQHATARWVHGKFLTFKGSWGSACLYGSPNMTSTALLQDGGTGNCEAALLSVFPDGRSAMEGTLFANEAFEFELSAPVESLDTLSLREESYEGWEKLRDSSDRALRLLDARLTQPDTDGVSELILRVDELEGLLEVSIETERDAVSRRVDADADKGEISIPVEEGDRHNWANAVVRVSSIDGEANSNPRLVNEESRAYFREFREITQSGGTQSATSLLKQILQNPDTAAINVFDVALSELRSLSVGQGKEVSPQDESIPSFEERSAARLVGNSSSTPSIHSIVERHLDYQLDQAKNALDFDDLPTLEEFESFLTHLETFFETVELCILLDVMGELKNESVLKVCQARFRKFLDLHSEFTTGLSRLADVIEANERVKETFMTEPETEVRDLEFWADAFDLLYLHPTVILELEYKSGNPIIQSYNQFANRLNYDLVESDPAIWQYLFDFTYFESALETHAQNLLVRHSEEDPSVRITGDAFQALLLYILVQRTTKNEQFLAEISSHPRYGEEAIRRLAQYALDAEPALFEYGLVSKQQWTIVLKQGREVVESVAGEIS